MRPSSGGSAQSITARVRTPHKNLPGVDPLREIGASVILSCNQMPEAASKQRMKIPETEVTPEALKRAEKARARIRQHVWDLLPAVPASKVAGTDLGEVVVLDADATLVTAHSEKDQARATFKGGYGFHPLGVWCDNTQEMLAITL